MRVSEFTKRTISAVGRRVVGKDFADLMALGCDVIKRFDADPTSVCLTFDDSPHPTSTLRLLAELKRQEVLATFFCIGAHVTKYPDLAAHVAAEGHEVANHSMMHPNFYTISPRRAMDDLKRSQDHIARYCGQRPTSFRAPFGNFRWDLRWAKKYGLEHLVKWDVAPRWDETDEQVMAADILGNVRGGSIILMHDGLGVGMPNAEAVGEAAAKCVEIVAPALKARGLHFRTISECAARIVNQPSTSPSPDVVSQLP
jgi:peptidoglycan/xylan/chitin deacetylase (PgdA/CDA1 family)